jgi:hypothetical protein
VVLLMRLGVVGSFRIAVRYARASARLIRECYARTLDGGMRQMRRARASLRRFARQTGVSQERLEALRSLYVEPAVKSLNFVMRSLYLDRIVSFLLATGFAVSALLLAQLVSGATGGLCAIPAAVLGTYACIGRGSNTGPQTSMQRGAERIASLFRARWVVMGHTHRPTVTQVAPGASYVNLGSWGQDDPPDERSEAHKSSCTYMLIRRTASGYQGELLRWDMERGPCSTAFGPELREVT